MLIYFFLFIFFNFNTLLNFKIILPTGTLVEIKFVSWPTQNDLQLNIDIYPSPSDVGKSSGLCGILDGNYRNDFRRKDGIVDNPDLYHYHNPPDEFSDSWRYIHVQ